MKLYNSAKRDARQILATQSRNLFDAQHHLAFAETEEAKATAQKEVDILNAVVASSKTLVLNMDIVYPKKDSTAVADIVKVTIPAAATIAGAVIGYLGVKALVTYEKDDVIRGKNAANLAIRNVS